MEHLYSDVQMETDGNLKLQWPRYFQSVGVQGGSTGSSKKTTLPAEFCDDYYTIFKGGYAHVTCIFVTFIWLTLTSEVHFVKFHPKAASCLLSSGKRKYAPLGMRLLWKYIRNYFLVYHLISHFLLYLQNYKEFEAEILDLQLEK